MNNNQKYPTSISFYIKTLFKIERFPTCRGKLASGNQNTCISKRLNKQLKVKVKSPYFMSEAGNSHLTKGGFPQSRNVSVRTHEKGFAFGLILKVRFHLWNTEMTFSYIKPTVV